MCAPRVIATSNGVTLGQVEAVERIVGGRKPDKLPLVLSAEEIARFLQAVAMQGRSVVFKNALH
jgi:hypothetical protein